MSNGTTPGHGRGSFSFLGAVALVAAVGLTACGADDGRGPPPSTPASTASTSTTGLTAVVDQFREDEIIHVLQVRLTNHDEVTYKISSMQLEWPGLTTVAPTPRDTLVVPGQTIDVPIDYGTAVCAEHPPGADESPPGAAAVAIATVTPQGAAAEQATIAVTDELHIFERIFPSDCRDQRVAAAVSMRFGDTWTPTTQDGKPALAGTLDVRRADTRQPITISSVGGSVLLDLDAADGAKPAVLVLATDVDSGQIPLVIGQSGNCTAHALAESKKTFILPVEVVLGSDAPINTEVTIDVDARTQFNQMINAACGTA